MMLKARRMVFSLNDSGKPFDNLDWIYSLLFSNFYTSYKSAIKLY